MNQNGIAKNVERRGRQGKGSGEMRKPQGKNNILKTRWLKP